ncbi:hypothetical protein [Streptomyces sp. NPDC058548]|uniref:hypothetical protein n=1 Tax=Streptomyces sp. NPDC058548 TaxID=3346545 RepID=UPI003662CA4C
MNPESYAALYGPARPARSHHGTGVAVVAAVLWAVALVLLGGLGFLALWGQADTGATDGIPLNWVLICLAIAAVPTGLLCTPAVRRWSVPARAFVTGLATCTIAVGLTVWAA